MDRLTRRRRGGNPSVSRHGGTRVVFHNDARFAPTRLGRIGTIPVSDPLPDAFLHRSREPMSVVTYALVQFWQKLL